jgi:arylsulfatase A-like enzyme
MNPSHPESTLRRRDFLKMGAAAAAVPAMEQSALGVAASPSARPNIVFVFSDEHRWQSLPFTETPQMRTPHMARLATQGTRFDNCCATSPICTPFRGMLITGQWPHQSSCISNDYFGNSKVIGKESPTIAHTFKAAGYRTGYIGKWHLDEDTVFDAGFDTFKHWLYGDDHWKTKFRDVSAGEKEYRMIEGYNATGMTDQAIDFMKENAGGKAPFLLMLSINPPHWRWDDAPPEFLEHYPADQLPFRPNVAERYKSGKEAEFYRHYLAHIGAVDREIGRLMDHMDQLGLSKNTVFIYTSDHGSSFGSNGVGSKANPYEESVRVPFFIRWPDRIPAGRVADHNLGGIDFYPTLCGLAGITPPKDCGGRDFSRVILGKSGPDPATQFTLFNSSERNYFLSRLNPGTRGVFSPFRSVRSKTHTYAVDGLGEWFLYDNQNDPYQMKNLVGDPAHAGVKAELQKELQQWLAKAEDPFIPEEWRKLSLPERIAAQNEHYSLIKYQQEWDALRAAAVQAHAAKANPAQRQELEAAAIRIYDKEFFGLYKAIERALNGPRKFTDIPPEELQSRQTALGKSQAAQFKAAAAKILARA